jgi:cytochrome b561
LEIAMPAKKSHTQDGYDRLSLVFHWATLVLLIAAFATIEGRVLFEKGTAIRTFAKESHYVLGLLILLFTLARLTHRLGSGARPAIHPAPAAPMMLVAHAMAAMLYASLLITPVLGLLTVQVLGDHVNLGFGLSIPAFVGSEKDVGKTLQSLHSLLGDTMYVLIGAHAAAGILHHVAFRDTTLANMVPSVAAHRSSVSGMDSIARNRMQR